MLRALTRQQLKDMTGDLLDAEIASVVVVNFVQTCNDILYNTDKELSAKQENLLLYYFNVYILKKNTTNIPYTPFVEDKKGKKNGKNSSKNT